MIDFNSDIKFATDKNINKVDDAGKTALIWAVYNKNLEMVNALLDKGADVNVVEKNEGKTALIWAAYNNNLEMVNALLDKGADVNVVEKNEGKTALIWAAYNNNLEMVNALLDKGADREIKGKNGKRAIDYASDAIKPILMK